MALAIICHGNTQKEADELATSFHDALTRQLSGEATKPIKTVNHEGPIPVESWLGMRFHSEVVIFEKGETREKHNGSRELHAYPARKAEDGQPAPTS